MYGGRPHYDQRLAKDYNDAICHDFGSSSAKIHFTPVNDEFITTTGLNLSVCILEGPYRGGHFTYHIEIPSNYPFKCVDIWATSPIWHPNIDLRTGRVSLPIQWSPVLTLVSVGLAIQVLIILFLADYIL